MLIVAADSHAVARHLLAATPAPDLQITPRRLEDAFLALTGTNRSPRPFPTAGFRPWPAFLADLPLAIRGSLRNRRTVTLR